MIKGQAGYDPSSFFDTVKESVIDLLISNSSTKVVLVFHCVVKRINNKTGLPEFILPYFRTAPEINIRGTDLNELYQKMTDVILEKIVTFDNEGTDL